MNGGLAGAETAAEPTERLMGLIDQLFFPLALTVGGGGGGD